MNLKDTILNRIDQLLEKEQDHVSYTGASEIAFALTNILETIYGPGSLQLDQVEALRKQVYDGTWPEHAKPQIFAQGLYGYLHELKAAIKEERIVNIQSEARGEVLGDFLVLAREAVDAGQKDVASVLACAALEDTLKRCASERGLNVQGKTMQTVVNALKSVGIIRGTQSALLNRFIELRNHAFHAEWDEIDTQDVKDIARFTEEFLAYQFSSLLTADSSVETPADT